MKVRYCRRACWLWAALAIALAAQARPAQLATSTLSSTENERALPQLEGPSNVVPAASDTYIIGADDLLSIYVYSMPDLDQQVRVTKKGTFALPLLDADIVAAGLTPPQVGEAVAKRLAAAGIANRPQVLVSVREVASRPVVIGGAVRYPLVVQAVRPISIAEGLARAGGVSPEAGTEVLVQKPGEPAQSYSLQMILLNPNAAPPLLGGESVEVPPAQMIYVVGALGHPGAFPLQTNAPITVLKAVALAQGFSTTTPPDRKNAEIIRVGADGNRQLISVPLDKILQHRADDPALQPGDILFVPESGRRKLLDAAMADAAQAAIVGLAYH